VQAAEVGTAAAGSCVRITLAAVPAAAAENVCNRVSAYLLGHATPLTAFGLLKHESKLSVVNMSVRRCGGYTDPVGNKEEVVIITGTRTFTSTPILSSDEYNMDKFKMERFMHPGRSYVLTVYAPISYPPLPVLVLKQVCQKSQVGLSSLHTLFTVGYRNVLLCRTCRQA
jgi:pre-rRNA-processing protein TSR1